MKNYFLILILIAGLGSNKLLAQQNAPEIAGMMQDSYQQLKSIQIKNPEKDTYLKLESGFILDRQKPPYTFKFNDGIIRKFYVYQIFNAIDLKSVGLLALFNAAGSDKALTLPIPNAKAAKEIWGLYIDDIKAYEKESSNYAACLAFMLTKEGLGAPVAEESGEDTEEEYEYCFPGDAQVMLANGESKAIQDLQKGDMILSSTEPHSPQWKAEPIQKVIVHQKSTIPMYALTLSPQNILSASLAPVILPEYSLEATGNHPVLTQRGKLCMEQIRVGDILYSYHPQTGEMFSCKVMAVESFSSKAQKVYNLGILGEVYLVNGLIVYKK
ncbi:MAG: Hint domain-containing protein [Microscillaceae bacterium]|nr:Hint domain-containing protein [Microscillaceae bacterium]